MRFRSPLVVCALLLALSSRLPAAPAAASPAFGEESLPLAPDVRDPVFALLVAYVRGDRFGVVTQAAVARTLDGQRQRSRLPWQLARDFERTPGTIGAGPDGPNLGDAGATLTIRFAGLVDTPIPYHILWYHPGRIRASASCRFREWRFAELPLEAVKGRPLPPLADVRLFALDEGEIFIDIDAWLDALLGDALDDTWISALALGRFREREYAFAVGRNRAGQPRIGAFDLSGDAVVFPLPPDLRAANRAVRHEYERRRGPSPIRP